MKIYISENINMLIKKACDIIKEKKNILLENIFIVNNHKISKWIEIFITKKIGIFANIKFYTLENFFCKIFKKKIFFKDFDLFWEILLNQKNKYIKKIFKNKFNEKKKFYFH